METMTLMKSIPTGLGVITVDLPRARCNNRPSSHFMGSLCREDKGVSGGTSKQPLTRFD